MIEISSGLSQKSSAIFGNLQKFLENLRQHSLDKFWRIFVNLWKIINYVVISMSI